MRKKNAGGFKKPPALKWAWWTRTTDLTLIGVRSNQLSYKPEGFPQARERKSIPVLRASPSL